MYKSVARKSVSTGLLAATMAVTQLVFIDLNAHQLQLNSNSAAINCLDEHWFDSYLWVL